MKYSFKPGFALAGLTCALLGATLAGCNKDSGNSGGMIGATSGSSGDTLATVGTSKITRADLTTFLEAQGGEQALPILIDTQLIFEALKAKSLDVSDAEVDADLARRQATDPSLAALLTGGGPRVSIIKTQIKRELAVQKLLTAGITASDAQLKSFFEKNRRYYDTPEKVTVGMLLASTKTRADLMAEQLKKKTKTLAQLVAEQKKAADPVASNSTESEQLARFPSPIAERVRPLIAKLPKGGIAPVQNFGGQAYAVFVVADKTASVKADFTKLRPEIEADYKSAEVAKKTVEAARKVAAANPQMPKNPESFDENVRRSFEAIQGQNPNATLRDALNYINQTTANELISGLRTAGTVQVEDATYAKVATPYQAKTGASDATATGNSASGNAASGNAAPAAP